AGGVRGRGGGAIKGARGGVRVSRELGRLRDDAPLPKKIEELPRVVPDKPRLRALFTELEFWRLADQLSPSGAAAIAPHAEKTPAPLPVTAVPEAIAPVLPPPPVAAVTKRADLEAIAAEIRAAGALGIAALYDGPSAVRSDLVGLGLAWGDRRIYVRLCHRYLGAPACLPGKDALAGVAPLAAVARG